jgi:type II secretory pathway pseudopilin PulG
MEPNRKEFIATSYVAEELDGVDRQEFEDSLGKDEARRNEVNEIRALIGNLKQDLRNEPHPHLMPFHREQLEQQIDRCMKRVSWFSSQISLIEFCIVISIMGILVGLLMPALRSARDQSKKMKAQSSIQALAMGLKAYFNEYGHWPQGNSNGIIPATELHARELGNLYRLMAGEDVYLDGSPGGNPRRIAFIDFRKRDIQNIGNDYRVDSSGPPAFVDPWKHAYHVSLDHNDDGRVAVFGSAVEMPINMAIWSTGPDGVENPEETDPLNPKLEENKDNITTWR